MLLMMILWTSSLYYRKYSEMIFVVFVLIWMLDECDAEMLCAYSSAK